MPGGAIHGFSACGQNNISCSCSITWGWKLWVSHRPHAASEETYSTKYAAPLYFSESALFLKASLFNRELCPWCSECCPTGTSIPARFCCYSVSCRSFFSKCVPLFFRNIVKGISGKIFTSEITWTNVNSRKAENEEKKKLSPSSLEATDSPEGNRVDIDLLPAQCLIRR